MVREINTIGNPVLNKICVPCEPRKIESFLSVVTDTENKEYWSDEIIELVTDLKDTAQHNIINTLGLAAPQIWWKDTPCPAVFVVKVNLSQDPSVPVWGFSELINPKLTFSGQALKTEEACLSVPNYSREIKRRANVTLEYQLVTGEEIFKTKLFGKYDYNAIVVQHEYDHLMGKLIKK